MIKKIIYLIMTICLTSSVLAYGGSSLILKENKHNKILVIDIWINNILQILQMFLRICLFVVAIFNPIILFYYIISIILISCFYSLYVITEDVSILYYRIIYSIINEFFLCFVLIDAIINIRKQGKWATR